MELVKLLLKNLKIILLFSIFIYLIFYIKVNPIKSKYYIEDTELIGMITKINREKNKTILEIKGKEKVYATYYGNISYKLGDTVKCIGNFYIPNRNTNFNLFNFRNYLLSKKIYIGFKINKIYKIKNNKNILYILKNKVINKLEKYNNKEYYYTFILGDSSYIKEDILNIYRYLGISHLFAISGMHVSMLTSFLNKNKITFFISLFFLFIYVFFTNYSPSIIRAVIFYIFSSLKIFNINIKSINYFIYTLLFLLIINPYYIYNIGFIFSFTVSFFLIICAKYIPNDKLKKSIYISFISFLASIPILLLNFYFINILTILYNLFYIPLVSILFPLILLSYLFPFLSIIVDIIVNILESSVLIFSNIKSIVNLPKINIYILIIYYLILYLIIIKKIKKRYIYIPIILYFVNNLRIYNTITFIDVGQGDSSLIELANGKNILIDTGGKHNFQNYSNYNIIPFLKSRGITNIDYLILTHGDYDHMGEAINLVNSFKVDKVIFNNGEYNDLELELIKVLEEKNIMYYQNVKQLNINNNKLYFINDDIYDNENDNSNIVYTKLNNYKFLFMGDAGINAEKFLLEKYNLKNVDILKVGHHGSDTSSSKEFIDIINPNYSIISVGKNNIYGHPSSKILDNLKKTKVYRTDKNGSIKFIIKNNKLKIETCIS